MPPRRPRSNRRRWLLAGAALISTSAWAFPWDIDMVDAQFERAYEWVMMTPPEGAVSRDHSFRNYDRTTPEGQALKDPYPVDDVTLAKGQRMFEVYCQTCHGEQGKGGAPVADNKPAEEQFRYKMPPPKLSGETGISALRTDGYIYLTVRNGGAIMPSYGAAMNDDEIWAVVAWLRTLPGAQAPTTGPLGGN